MILKLWFEFRGQYKYVVDLFEKQLKSETYILPFLEHVMYELRSSWTIKHNQSILGRLRDSSNSVAICGLLSAKSKQT